MIAIFATMRYHAGNTDSRQTMTKTLDNLRKQQAQIEAQIQDAEAREKQRERKARTSRLIVLGALLEHDMTANPDSENTRRFTAMVDEYTFTDAHRRLFDLPLLDKDEKAARSARARSRKVKF